MPIKGQGCNLMLEASMISSVYNNISALFAFGAKMGVNANNLANVNTDAFKKAGQTLLKHLMEVLRPK